MYISEAGLRIKKKIKEPKKNNGGEGGEKEREGRKKETEGAKQTVFMAPKIY